MHRRYVPFARYIWEHQHGPLPAGMLVVHRDGDSMNDDVANLIAIRRRDLPAHQQRANPKIEPRRRLASSKAGKQRWAAWRAKRAAPPPSDAKGALRAIYSYGGATHCVGAG